MVEKAEKESARRVGIIGGSGFYELEGLQIIEEVGLSTPWGVPSSPLVLAKLKGKEVVFLARHGKGHRLLPGEINYRANIAALKHLGVREVVAFSAVGSLREEIKPLDFALPDQLIDRTKSRPASFFGNGVVGHVSFADPYCPRLQDLIAQKASEIGITLHRGETLVCIEGPTFSTRAESKLYRSWGAGLINMSALPEARLAKEAELCYALVCMVTDYDCWRSQEEEVAIDEVIKNMMKNTENAKRLVSAVVELLGGERSCRCSETCSQAIITAPGARDPAQEEKLRYLLPNRFPESYKGEEEDSEKG